VRVEYNPTLSAIQSPTIRFSSVPNKLLSEFPPKYTLH
jgi:hypothetical protein